MRWLVRSLAVLFAACAVLVTAAWLVNRPRFDTDLVAEVRALKAARPAATEDNAYPIAMAFLAGDDTIPNKGRGSWQSKLKGLECVARVDLDCADRLVAEVGSVNFREPRLDVLSGRFEILLHQQQLDEGQRRDANGPFAPYGAMRDVARVLLAEGFGEDSDAAFIARALEHLRFWKLVLRQGQTLAAKMVAIAAIQDTLDFLSALMRERTLATADADLIEQGVTPLTPAELDISDAFLTETRNLLFSAELPLAEDASRTDRLMLQRNATLNEFHVSIIEPILLRAKLSPAEFYRTGGNRPLDLSAGHHSPLLFNRGGDRLVHEMVWDPEQFLARTQDQNGRLILVALQAELERASRADRDAVTRSSPHRNPYTGEPMQFDVRGRTIGFQCLHTAYHPPALPDQCAVRIDSIAR